MKIKNFILLICSYFIPNSGCIITGNVLSPILFEYNYDKENKNDHYAPANQNYTSGAVNILKLETVNNIMSGTFSFILIDSVVVSNAVN
jgi:hypothetical protein